MPNNWKTYKLSEVVKVIDSLHKTPKYSIEGFPMVRAQDITGGNINLKNVIKVSEDVYNDFSKNHKTKIGDLILSRVGAHCGKVSFVNTTQSFCLGQNTVFIIPEKANNKFIYFLLSSELIQSELEKTAVVSTYKTISLQTLRNLEINIPPIQEQQSIASILSAIDDKIENNLAINKTLEEIAMALYKHWFVDFGPFKDGEFVESELGMIPEGWEVKRLDELADFTNGYAFKSGDLKIDNDGNSYHIFKMGHIERGGGLKENATKSYIDKLKCVKLEKYILKVGDLLMAMTDMKDNVAILGNTALINENDKYIVNQRVGLIRPKNNLGIDYSFLFLTTNENSFIERLRSQANSGVQVNLSTDAIKSAKMIIGSKEINVKFDEIVKPLYNNIFQNKIENQTLTQLRDTLLPKLISGEVRLKEFRE